MATTARTAVIVVAKEPLPGRVKTRLCPPCTPRQAADLAAAALADTLEAASAAGAEETILALDGAPGAWCPPGVRIVAQGAGTFGARLGRAWSAVTGPAVQIGMDTPQVTADLLDDALDTACAGAAVLGEAEDGGWWLLGLPRPTPGAFDGVPMSTPATGAAQRARLETLGLDVMAAPSLRDVDHFDDALAVAAAVPGSRFAAAVARIPAGRAVGGHR